MLISIELRRGYFYHTNMEIASKNRFSRKSAVEKNNVF
ncbi:NADH:ubiquinone oxidoreductase, na [Aggregatibacter aphrophilus NJ8700]|nr:NADH:ubiquinone oxidoreductase, na [Aggregatibacter aphrophilus NJ8700]PNL93588.1 NADH:ubiquinone oxidoreductase [Aggregatibacter aphrophilus]RDE88249.1 NADH:ubiquinone oxidoreductase [Aggregatibacter aphrophilus]